MFESVCSKETRRWRGRRLEEEERRGKRGELLCGSILWVVVGLVTIVLRSSSVDESLN